jgi:hypothetical protein
MDDSYSSGLAAFGTVGFLFLLLLAVLWVLVPFAIFGIKGLLRDLIHAQNRNNELVLEMMTGIRDGTWPETKK